MNPIRVLLADGQRLVSDVTRQMFEREPDLIVVGSVSNGQELIEAAREEQPDVVLADISLPGGHGVEVTRLVHEVAPHTAVLMMTLYDEPACVSATMDAGACGCVLKNVRGAALIEAVRRAKS